MTARQRRAVGAKPKPRTVEVTGSDLWATWACTARVDFPARLLADLQSGSVDRILAAMGVIIVSHNFPGEDGELAADLGSVDPYTGLVAMAGEVIDAIGKVPNR